MTALHDLLNTHVETGSVPGVVALLATGDHVEVQVAGHVDTEKTAPMTRDALFRTASITKPIVAAAVMTLVDDGWIALDDPVDAWLPELSAPTVVRTPASPVDDVVPAARPITVFDLLTSRAGYGFAADFTLPAVQLLVDRVEQNPRNLPVDEWLATLAGVPLLHHPGERWLYNTCSDLQGVLISRVTGRPLPDVLAERLFEPLGMRDTAFAVPKSELHRLTSCYDADLTLVDAPSDASTVEPVFPSGAGGLISTVDDWHAFARLLLDGGRDLLSRESVRLMTTDHLTEAQRRAGALFLDGQGWGFGGSVDVTARSGRYGWVGGTGTSAHVVPTTGEVAILLTQVAMDGPTAPALLREFWSL